MVSQEIIKFKCILKILNTIFIGIDVTLNPQYYKALNITGDMLLIGAQLISKFVHTTHYNTFSFNLEMSHDTEKI